MLTVDGKPPKDQQLIIWINKYIISIEKRVNEV